MKKAAYEFKIKNVLYTVKMERGKLVIFNDTTGRLIHSNRDDNIKYTEAYAEAYLNKFL